jgi:hypothetical protein
VDVTRPRIAVLSRKPLADHPYDAWLADLCADLLVFAEDTAANRVAAGAAGQRFAEVSLFPDWKTNRAVDLAVLAAHDAAPIDRIVALSECDLIRAAELRDRLGVAGQSPASARAYRDKAVMKTIAAAAGLATPAWCAVNALPDLMNFAARHGRIVVKPIDGAGARDVVVLTDVAAVERWASKAGLPSDEPPRLIAEKWIDAPMLSVDGLMAGGKVRTAMVGRYTATCLDSVRFGRPHGILQLDADDPVAGRAMGYVQALVAALPAPEDPTSFHAELFDPPGGPMLCEIASRTGGGHLDRMAREVLGVGLDQASCAGQAGATVDLGAARSYRGGVFGDLMVPRLDGVLVRAPDHCPLPGVVDFRVRVPVGVPSTRATKVSECAADALLRARNHEELRQLYDGVVAWLGDAWQWA